MSIILYDHLMRLPADAPNRLDDLRKGPLGVFGAVQKRSTLFMRPKASPLVTNVIDGAYAPGGRVVHVTCFLGFEPRTEKAGYDDVHSFVSSLAAAMKWEIHSGGKTDAVIPAYTSSDPFSFAESDRQTTEGIEMAPGDSVEVICTIDDERLVEALNTGHFKDTQFGVRIIRLALQIEPP